MADRLFIGLPLQASARDALQEQLRAAFPEGLPGKPVPPENWHFTVRFLGATETAVAERIQEALHDVSLGRRFRCVLSGMGAFPRPARSTVLWAGVGEGREQMQALAAAVEARLRSIGIVPEERPFAAHLTLSRLREPRDMRPALAAGAGIALPLEIAHLVLFRSHLGGSPPRYEEVVRVGLEPAR